MGDDTEKPAARVTVLDAFELDKEIHNILKEQVNGIMRYLPPGYLGVWESELDALLRIVVWKLSVQRTCATFGQQILKLKYDHNATRTRLNLLGILTIGSHYLQERIPTKEFFINRGFLFCLNPLVKMVLIVRILIDKCLIGIKMLDIIALIMFFHQSKASTFVERLLGLKPVSIVPASARNIKYSYMTRELIWHGFIELLIFVIPLVNYHSLRRRLNHILHLNNTRRIKRQTPKKYTKYNRCPVCKEMPILPHHMGCYHFFCYYCLAANRTADKKFECPLCGHFDEDESAMKPYDESMIEHLF